MLNRIQNLFTKNIVRVFFVAVFLMVLSVIPTQASASTYYHDGLGQITDASSWWNEPDFGNSTGISGTVPNGSGDTGILQTGITIDTNSETFTVDYTLQVDSGASLIISSGSDMTLTGTLTVNGQVSLQGSGSSLGISSTGVVNVNSGASWHTTTNSSINVSGAFNMNTGSTIDSDSSATLSVISGGVVTVRGTYDAQGAFNINTGGVFHVTSDSAMTTTNSTFTVAGGSFNLSNATSVSLNTDTTFTMTSGAININNGAALTSQSGVILNLDGGTVSITSGGSTLTANDTVNVASGMTMDIYSGGTFNINGSTLSLGGTLTVQTGGIFVADGSTITEASTGTTNISGGNFTVSNASTFTSEGTLNLSSGSLIVNASNLVIYTGSTFTSTANLVVTDNASMTVMTGTTSTLNNLAEITIGTTSTLTLDGLLAINSGSTINIDSGSTLTVGINTDISGGATLNVEGTANIGTGGLDIEGDVVISGGGAVVVTSTLTIATSGSVTVGSSSTLTANGGTISNSTDGALRNTGGTIDIINSSGGIISNENPSGYSFSGVADSAITPFSIMSVTGNGASNYNALLAAGSPSSFSGTAPDGLSIDLSTGEVTGTPTGAGAGTFTITMIGADGTASQEVDYSISAPADVTPPTVNITSPSAGEVSGLVTVTAEASDVDTAVEGVLFKYNNTNIAPEDTSDPYSVSWDTTDGVSDGDYTLYAVARDTAGNRATSTIEVTVNNNLPSVSNVATSSVTETGITIDWDTAGVPSDSLVEYGLSSTYTASSTYSASLVTSHTRILTGLTPGTLYHFRVISVDGQGSSDASADDTFTTSSDTTPPDLSNIASSTSVTTATVSWDTDEASDSKVSYGTVSGTYTTASSSATLLTTGHSIDLTGLSSATQYYFVVVSKDGSNNIATSSENTFLTTVAPDITVPVVSITAPTNGATVIGNAVSITANASDDTAVSGVQFKVGNTNIGSEDTTAAYGVTWDSTGVSDGSQTLYAVARDAAGNRATSTITVMVDNTTGPILSSVSSGSVTTSGATISWTTNEAADTLVEYGLSSTYTASSTYSATLETSHSVILSGLSSNTEYHYRVISIDGQGNRTNGSDNTFTTSAVSSGGGGGGGGSGSSRTRTIVNNPNPNNIGTSSPVIVGPATNIQNGIINKFTRNTIPKNFLFTRDLTLGSVGEDVKLLQKFLNENGTAVAWTGVGSIGFETTYFGNKTRIGLAKFQNQVGITPIAGYFGPKTRAYINALLLNQ